MLRSGVVPAVRLTEIFRQAQESLIVMNAHRVNGGILPDLKTTTSDFFFLRRRAEEAVAATIGDLCRTRLAGPDGHPAGGNPGSLPHAEGPHRYGQPEPAAAGSAESALSREEGEKGGIFPSVRETV